MKYFTFLLIITSSSFLFSCRSVEKLVDKGRYDEAIDFTDKWIHIYPGLYVLHLNLAVADSLLGRDEDAKTEVEKALKFYPNLSLKKQEHFLGFKDQNDKNRYISALRKAGLPE